MSASMFNSQRGLSFDPAMARIERERKALREAAEARRQVAAAAREARAEKTRQYARMLDQVEVCYRERARDRRYS